MAYADFVTALMALFMVLWISSQNVEVRKATSKFFQNPYNAFPEQSSGMMDGQVAGANRNSAHADPTVPQDAGYLRGVAREFYRLLNVAEDEESPVDVEITSEGLKLTIYDRTKKPLFLPSTAEFTEWGLFVVQTLAWLVERYEFRVYIDGHTAKGLPEIRKQYGAWELSADRANAARRGLEHYAVSPRKMERVTGFGDTVPLPNSDPTAESNQRITVSLSIQQQTVHKTALVQKPPTSRE